MSAAENKYVLISYHTRTPRRHINRWRARWAPYHIPTVRSICRLKIIRKGERLAATRSPCARNCPWVVLVTCLFLSQPCCTTKPGLRGGKKMQKSEQRRNNSIIVRGTSSRLACLGLYHRLPRPSCARVCAHLHPLLTLKEPSQVISGGHLSLGSSRAAP